MKKVLAFLLAGCLIFTACSSNTNDKEAEVDTGSEEEVKEKEDQDEDTDTEKSETGDDTETEKETEGENAKEDTKEISKEEKSLSDIGTPAQDKVISNQESAEGHDEAKVSLDKLTYTAQAEETDDIGATNVFLTLTNNSEYGIADYILKIDDQGQDIEFTYSDGIPAGESSEAFSAFLKNADNIDKLQIKFISYNVLVSDTEGYTIRYNSEKNKYSVNELSSDQILSLEEKLEK